MKDNIENKLDELFDAKNKKSKKVILTAKIKSITTIVVITSILVSLLYFWGTRIVINKIDLKLLDKKNNISSEIKEKYELMHPNQFLGTLSYENGFLTGHVKYDTYKIIGQNIVHTEPVERNFDINGMFGTETTQEVSTDKAGKGVSIISPGSLHDKLKDVDFFNTLGQREMIFFYPFSDYKNLYRNDLEKLDEIDNKKVAEMSLSLDKYYSIEEINKMIPKDLNITWYWVDTLSEKQKSDIIKSDENATKNIMDGYEGTRKDGIFRKVVSEDTAIGIKAIDSSGFKIDNPLDQFVKSLYNSSCKSDEIKYLKGLMNIKQVNNSNSTLKYNAEDIKIGGIVVTGSIEQLKSLKKVSNIKASTFGVICDKY